MELSNALVDTDQRARASCSSASVARSTRARARRRRVPPNTLRSRASGSRSGGCDSTPSICRPASTGCETTPTRFSPMPTADTANPGSRSVRRSAMQIPCASSQCEIAPDPGFAGSAVGIGLNRVGVVSDPVDAGRQIDGVESHPPDLDPDARQRRVFGGTLLGERARELDRATLRSAGSALSGRCLRGRRQLHFDLLAVGVDKKVGMADPLAGGRREHPEPAALPRVEFVFPDQTDLVDRDRAQQHRGDQRSPAKATRRLTRSSRLWCLNGYLRQIRSHGGRRGSHPIHYPSHPTCGGYVRQNHNNFGARNEGPSTRRYDRRDRAFAPPRRTFGAGRGSVHRALVRFTGNRMQETNPRGPLMKKITTTIGLSVLLATGLLAGRAVAGEALETRKDVREATGVEAGDRAEAVKPPAWIRPTASRRVRPPA